MRNHLENVVMSILFLEKLKYVVMYCNQEEMEMIKNKVQRLPFVKDVVESYRPFLKTEYENSKPDKAKEYDYKVGL